MYLKKGGHELQMQLMHKWPDDVQRVIVGQFKRERRQQGAPGQQPGR